MSGANKILTVSYGTFSCTIEGFEDPFGTMKQIAEYFRDLAAEDRYFGAEPPVPDAEALRHLAEREAARRVEARMGAGGVHLRQLDDAAAAQAATPVSQPAPDAAATMVAAAAVAAKDVLTPSEVIDPEPESVAARLSRIRAVVARARSTSVWPDEAIEVPDVADGSDAVLAGSFAPEPFSAPAAQAFAEPGHPEPVEPVSALGTPTSAFEAEDVGDVTLTATDEHDDQFASADMPEAGHPRPEYAAVEASEIESPAEVEPEVAVVSDAIADAAEVRASDEFEHPHEESHPPAPDHVALEPVDAGDEDPLDPVSELDFLTTETEAAELPVLANEAPAGLEAPAPGPDAYEEAGTDDAVAATLPETMDTPAARLVALRKADHAAAVATDRLEDVLSGRIAPDDVYSTADDTVDARHEDSAVGAADDGGDRDDRTASLLAAIRAIGKDEVEDEADEEARTEGDLTRDAAAVETDAVVEEWQLDTVADDEALDYSELAAPPLRLDNSLRVASVSDDEPDAVAVDAAVDGAVETDLDGHDADLQDQFGSLDEAEAPPLMLSADPELDDVDGEGPELGADPADDGASDAGQSARAGHDLAVEDLERVPEETSVDRLLAETNSQLESTEVNRRRSAIAHLKAAVAAARADKVAPETGVKADEGSIGSAIDKFREDLARVVRPRRPVDDGQPRTVRRMPPLMLVSEQRVDVAEVSTRSHDALAGTVRPRRVTTREVSSDEGEEVSSGGFAVFAETMGARDLPDMLEAAAAYTAFVEGRPSFSRPQLMQMMRVGEGAEDEFSREEQLRSFGLLLRQGRIQKLKRGQFTVADDTRFRPEQRHAGE